MIILFDVDGVLVQSRAYRVSLQNTVRYFSQRLGLGEVTLTDEDMEVFESQSITVEGDSGAICVAVLWRERQNAGRPRKPRGALGAAVDKWGARATTIERPDFSAL